METPPVIECARIILSEPLGLLTYRIPPELEASVVIGTPVKVPLGKRQTTGYIADRYRGPTPPFALKDIVAVDVDSPQLPEKLIALLLFASDYYHVLPGELLASALPANYRRVNTRYRLSEQGLDALHSNHSEIDVLTALHKFPRGFTAVVLERHFAWSRAKAISQLRRLRTMGFVEVLKKGKRKRKLEPAAVELEAPMIEEALAANPAQKQAITTILEAAHNKRFATFLLQGITGSGKTEIYLQVVADILAHGEAGLLLVPEIALTPQLSDRFRRRFGNKVATFHSGLTPAERRDEWERVARGEVQVGLGARSALFLPFKKLGVIVVDEEHEPSFKQEETPRYNARDLAVVRGAQENAVVILGSATPSLESHQNATTHRYQRLLLAERVMHRPLPEVSCVRLGENLAVEGGTISRDLAVALEETLHRGEQAILFLNRRGFAPFIVCGDCGHSFRCPDCAVSLTLHLRRDILLCHYCGFETPTVDECPSCQSYKLKTRGAGVERVDEELQHLFGPLRIARLDRDTVKKRADLQRELEAFATKRSPILLGTQMVTKGHDFPNVTLVGVLSADHALNLPDFRAAERTFQLLTQVAGRAGRGAISGRVIVQSYDIDHYAITTASRHDFEQFAAIELQSRRELAYPPYTHLALLRWEGRSESEAFERAREVAGRLVDISEERKLGVTILGPAPAPLHRLKGLFRFQLLFKSPARSTLHTLISHLDDSKRTNVRQILDVDPLNMM